MYGDETLKPDKLTRLTDSLLSDRELMRLEVSLRPEEKGIGIALRMGREKLYAVRQMERFLCDWQAGRETPLGPRLTADRKTMRLDRRDQQLVEELTGSLPERADALERAHMGERWLSLTGSAAARTLALLSEMRFVVRTKDEAHVQTGIRQEELPLLCVLSGTPRALKVSLTLEGDMTPLTADCRYVLYAGQVRRLPYKQRLVMSALYDDIRRGEAEYAYQGAQVTAFLSDSLPILYDALAVSVDDSLAARLRRCPLRAKVYLDRDGMDVVARVRFMYDEYEIDPFMPRGESGVLIYRDSSGEGSVMRCLSDAGFFVRAGAARLHDAESIYRFMTEGAEQLSRTAEVFFSRDFRQMKARQPRLSARMTARGGSIVLSVLDEDEPVDELIPLMRAIREKQKYFRLRSGAFLMLTGLTAWEDLARALTEDAESGGATDTLPERPLSPFKANYVEALAEAAGLPMDVDEESRALTALRYDAPPPPVSGLRDYQVTGYKWLMMLDHLRMGGILADDMGLGKTVQTIAAIRQTLLEGGERLPSLIVAPTSLLFNWLREFERFAPGVRVRIIQGSQKDREALWQDPEGAQVLITSYPLIRRDIQWAAALSFRFCVLDEAQQIKNTQSLSAQAVKRLRARTRIALTGTPMENHIGELWSLMDFCLPSYLPSYPLFLRRYGDEGDLKDLRLRIRPFLMRRVRQDVLNELPGYLEKTLFAELSPQQRRVYDAVVYQCRERVINILSHTDMPGGHAEVLAAITQLREICCHPALCMDGYQGGSGKEDLLMDVLVPALRSGHRALVFSQFTSMLRLLDRRFRQSDIEPLYLDGATPTRERQELTERFNAGEGQVFLISLKSGGTGLNLTGADTVVHYDPWWNPTAQAQATARAHRLGQEHTVTVLNLVTHGTIEEQVVSLGERKRRLFDRLITAGETMPDQLTREDILRLFD